jgi:hypothetical protein
MTFVIFFCRLDPKELMIQDYYCLKKNGLKIKIFWMLDVMKVILPLLLVRLFFTSLFCE